MRDRGGWAPPEVQERDFTRRTRLAPAIAVAILLAALAAYAVPRGLEAYTLLSIENDPAQLADRALAETFNADVAAREINAALEAKDVDLAKSFADLAAARHVTLDPALTEKVNAAVAEAASIGHAAGSFAHGLITGEPADAVSLAGTALGDLFVFGDVRDAVRETARLAAGEKGDELVLGLACVGLAITAGTYVTAGVAAPTRIGLSLAKAARKTGRLGGGLADSLSSMMRGMVDWSQLKRALAGVSGAEPALAIRTAREAVKVERVRNLVPLARNVGRVQAKAGTQAALDALKIAESPAELARVAKLAEKEGSKTRAILKIVGRGAIALSVAAFNLSAWIFAALLTVFGFVSSLKSAIERMTLRKLRRRKAGKQQRFAALTARV